MFSVLLRSLMVATSLAPVLLTQAIVARDTPCAIWWGLAAIALCVMAILLLRLAPAQNEEEVRIKAVKNSGQELLGFMLTYLLPLVVASSEQLDMVAAGFVLLLIALLVFHGNMYHVNPLLGIFGYRFYEITATNDVTYVLVTKRNLRLARRVERVVRLSEYMLLDVDRRPL